MPMAKFLYFFAAPSRPVLTTVAMSPATLDLMNSLPLKAGAIGVPCPVAPWQAEHFDLKISAPSVAIAEPATATPRANTPTTHNFRISAPPLRVNEILK